MLGRFTFRLKGKKKPTRLQSERKNNGMGKIGQYGEQHGAKVYDYELELCRALSERSYLYSYLS